MEENLKESGELRRILDLQNHFILDTPPEQDYDELVELAAMICNCPVSMISLIDKNRQWFKAKVGLEDTETHRDVSICSHAIQQDEVFVIENALADDQFAHFPAVTGGIRLRFYAGAPIVSSAGYKLGTLCVVDKRPKLLLPRQLEALKKLSRQASRLLELRLKTRQLEQLGLGQ